MLCGAFKLKWLGTKLEMLENPILAPFKHLNVSIKLFSTSESERDCLKTFYLIGEVKALFVFVSLV